MFRFWSKKQLILNYFGGIEKQNKNEKYPPKQKKMGQAGL